MKLLYISGLCLLAAIIFAECVPACAILVAAAVAFQSAGLRRLKHGNSK